MAEKNKAIFINDDLVDGANVTFSTVSLTSSESVIGKVVDVSTVISANFTRPADTNAYTSGDLIANNVTAASVVPLTFAAARVATGTGRVRRARLKKSNTTVTNGIFRLHLYTTDPSLSTGIANGDNGVWSTNNSGYLGYVDLDTTAATAKVFRDSAGVIGVPAVGTEIIFKLASGSNIYGLLEARAAYTPTSAEVFTVDLEVYQG
jgi:hypothetical protein